MRAALFVVALGCRTAAPVQPPTPTPAPTTEAPPPVEHRRPDWAPPRLGLDTDPAQVAFRYVDGLILVPAALFGLDEPLSFAIDSGSSVSAVTRRVATALELPLTAPREVAGAASAASLSAARIPALRIGGLEIAPSWAYVVDGHDEEIASCDGAYRIDGVVGASVLWQLVTAIDYDAKALVLSRQTLSPAKGEVVVPLRPSRYGDVLATARIGDEATPVLIDTGSAGSVTVPLPRLPIDGARVRKVEGTIMQDLTGPIAGGAFVRLPFGWPSSEVVIVDGAALPGLGEVNVGNELLDRYRVILDGPAKRMLLTPRGAPVPATTLGFTFSRHGRAFRVDTVVHGSAPHRAGVSPGDRVVTLAETDLAGLDQPAECRLRRRLAAARSFRATFVHEDNRVAVTVRRATIFD